MRFYALLFSLLLATPSAYSLEHSHTVIGWVEAITISPAADQVIEAKIDSGADHSSLHATDISYFEKDNVTWVTFRTLGDIEHQSPLLKTTRIKMKNGQTQQRPVITARLCIGNKPQEIVLNLVDRSHLEYAALIGRSAMKGLLINPAKKHLAGNPDCTAKATQ